MSDSEKPKRPCYVDVDGFRLPGCFYPEAFREAVNLKPRDSDVIIVTFPKCGTNWMRQIVDVLRNKGVPAKNSQEFMHGTPFLDMMGSQIVESKPDPRYYVTHLPRSILSFSKSAKYIWVVRNPKDCLVSFYHHTCSPAYDYAGGSFNQYFDIFLNGENDYGDYFDHVLSWYEHRNDPNVLLVYYEDMKKDLRGTIIRVAKFLGTEHETLIQDETMLNNIITYAGFEHMKKTVDDDPEAALGRFVPGVDIDSLPMPMGMKHMLKYVKDKQQAEHGLMVQLIRKGIVGDWRNNFTAEQNQRMNDKIAERLKDTELLEFWQKNKCL